MEICYPLSLSESGALMLQSINLSRLALALVVSYLAVLGFSYGRDKGFLIDGAGKPRLTEYIGVRAAGELVVAGRPSAAYDWDAHKTKHNEISGNTADSYYPWAYPPPYLFVAGALALMPYLLSTLVWILATMAFQIRAVVAIAGTSRAALWVLAAPPTFINVSVIHTGFLVAALVGLGMHLLLSAPVAAGVALGLLAFKPQFGILVPVALAGIGGRLWQRR
jgi:arabinofuranan 3-O-arabinosyltransferase